jgi:putative transposase
MALSFLYRLFRRVLGALRVLRIDTVAKDAEILVLRHQLAVLRHQVARPRFTWSDRAVVALLAGLVLPRELWGSFLVTPQTILGWHRAVVRRRWTYPHRRPGRPALPDETIQLICRFARENPRWGYLRIVGELKKLNVTVSKTSVAMVLRRVGLPPAPRREGPTWTQFLSAEAKGIVATDFFHVDTITRRRLYVPFFIDLERRKVFLAGVTEHPIGSWVTQQARNLTMTLEDERRVVKFLIRDRDTEFVGPFDEIIRSIGARVIKTPVRAPRANAFAERFVGTARRECLDWLLIRNARHLERVHIEFVEHYNTARPHRGIDLDVPIPYVRAKPLDDSMNIQRVDRLGGVLREYSIAA